MRGPAVKSRDLHRFVGVALLVGSIAFLPFVHGIANTQSFYFRDISRYFFPVRHFLLEGLLRGELRYWNPLAQEGIPIPFPPISYPFDLLQLLSPDPAGLSLILALHVPLAAVTFLLLGRFIGLSGTASAAGALVYALGGFCLSTLNLYVHLEAMAWAPAVILGMLMARRGGGGSVALAALFAAVALSTAGIEVVTQAVIVGGVLGFSRKWLGQMRVALSLVLGAGLAAPTLLVMSALVENSGRGKGFTTDVVLAQSIHPITFLQVIVGGFYGDLTDLTNRWWGSNFFPNGFPYILSLYLGPLVLLTGAVGILGKHPLRLRILGLLLLFALISMGRWAGLTPIVEMLPIWRKFRFPAKAFFTVHLAAALLTAIGIQTLSADRKAWRKLALLCLGIGALLTAAPTLPPLFPRFVSWFVSGFFPPGFSAAQRASRFDYMLEDAAIAGLVAVAAGFVGLLRLKDWLQSQISCLAIVGLIGSDLLRTGTGLNPMVTRAFFEPSREMSAEWPSLRRGRIFTCDIQRSRAYWAARQSRGTFHEVWSFATMLETETPDFNLFAGIKTAYGEDVTGLVPVAMTPTPEEGCASFGGIAERLRSAAVTHVLSLDPIEDPNLSLERTVFPPRIDPLSIHIYRLERPLPERFVARTVRPFQPGTETDAGQGSGFRDEGVGIEAWPSQPVLGVSGRILSHSGSTGRENLVVEASAPSALVVRESFAPGWSARVNGFPAPILRADGRYKAVPIKGGTSQVVLTYDPPGLRLGVLLMALTASLIFALSAVGPRIGLLARTKDESSEGE